MPAQQPYQQPYQPQQPMQAMYQPAQQPPPPQQPPVNKQQHYARLASQLDMPAYMVEDLYGVVGTEVVVIADDSGSMSYRGRWAELQNTLADLLKLLVTIDDDAAIELRFLNHAPPRGTPN